MGSVCYRMERHFPLTRLIHPFPLVSGKNVWHFFFLHPPFFFERNLSHSRSLWKWAKSGRVGKHERALASAITSSRPSASLKIVSWFKFPQRCMSQRYRLTRHKRKLASASAPISRGWRTTSSTLGENISVQRAANVQIQLTFLSARTKVGRQIRSNFIKVGHLLLKPLIGGIWQFTWRTYPEYSTKINFFLNPEVDQFLFWNYEF